MCDPVSIGFLVVSVVSTGYSVYQQDQNVDAQNKYQKELHKANTEIATQNALRSYVSLQRRQVQEREAAALDIQKVSLQSAAAQGTARAAAASEGTAGLSVEALINDFERQELQFQTETLRTGQFRDEQFRSEALGVQSGLQGQILSTLPQPVPPPDFLGAALRVGADAFAFSANRPSS